jgi:hypothetical protein
MFIGVLLGHDVRDTRAAMPVMIVVALTAIPFAMALDHLKRWMRTRLFHHFGPHPA